MCNCTRFRKGKTLRNIWIILLHAACLSSKLHNVMLHAVAGYHEVCSSLKNFEQPCKTPDMTQVQTHCLSFVMFGVRSDYLKEI